MHSNKPIATYKIFYIGLHPNTVIWLFGYGFEITGVAYIKELIRRTYNPASILFRCAYINQFQKRNTKARLILMGLKACKALLSNPYNRYYDQLLFLVGNNIPILDIDDDVNFGDFLKESETDIGVCNTWSVLPIDLVNNFPRSVINIHPSLLPEYSGALPTLWALKEEKRTSGVTFHVITDKIDRGDILAQYEINVENTDSIEFERKIDHVVREYLPKNLTLYLDGATVLMPQDDSKRSFTGKYEAYREVIWLEEKAVDIYNKVRLYPYCEPFTWCYFRLGSKPLYKIYIKGCALSRLMALQHPSKDVCMRWLSIYFMTRQGVIQLRLFRDVSLSQSLSLYKSYTQDTILSMLGLPRK